MKNRTFVTILAVTVLSLSQFAKVANAQDPHHPAGSDAAEPRQAAGSSNMPMMSMMRNMPMMADMMHMMSLDGSSIPTDHIEGRLAFLRIELKIGESQAAAWNDFANALRTNTQKLDAVKRSLAESDGADQTRALTLTGRIDQQDRWLSSRLDAIRAIKPALNALYSALSADQKHVANDLLGRQLGLSYMAGMPSPHQMPGAMQPGRMSPPAK